MVVCALVLASVSLAAARARAYRTLADDLGTTLPVERATAEVEVVVYGEGPAGVDPPALAAALDLAAAAWDVDCSAVRAVSGGSTGSAASDADGVTTISTVFDGWEARGYSATQAAITELRYVETATGYEISDADIFLNGETIDWTAADAPDVRAVLVHELGHCLGLAHSMEPAPQAIMFAEYQAGAWEPRADDVEGICALYPRSPCAGIVCADDEVCDAGACAPAPVCASGEPCVSGVCASGGEGEGSCVALASEGAPCASGDECSSRLCLTSMRAGSYCTRECAADDECGGAQRCAEVEGRQVCAPLPSSSSCAAMGARGSRGVLVVVLVAMSIARTRRRSRT